MGVSLFAMVVFVRVRGIVGVLGHDCLLPLRNVLIFRRI
jgi:hypothetical protein